MSSLEILTGRNYLSYSSLSSWLDCGERFRLERVLNAPQSDAWWFIAGDAIHKATEDCDIDEVTDEDTAHEYFLSVWNSNLAKLDRTKPIKAGGRATKEFPNKEDEAFWTAKGGSMVWNWVNWREKKFAEGWQFLPMPDGRPAIEVAVQVEFPDVLVKGYVDRILVSPEGEVVVLDLKSGSRQPASSLQLGVYALGVARNFGIQPSLGTYWMARSGEHTQPVSLLHYTYETVGRWFTNAKNGIEAGAFVPKVGPFCGSCAVAPYCKAVGGDDTPLLGSALNNTPVLR